jgi:hypothetical protein
MAWLAAAAERLLSALDWEREAYPAYDDFLALPLFALFFPTARFLLDRFVFEVRHALTQASVIQSKASFMAFLARGEALSSRSSHPCRSAPARFASQSN